MGVKALGPSNGQNRGASLGSSAKHRVQGPEEAAMAEGNGKLDESAIADFRLGIRGGVIAPGDADYDTARALNNGMIDKRPAVIARCVDVGDVITALRFGHEQGLDVAVRGGGHNGAGLASVDGGLMVDLSGIRGVRVDPDARTAQAGGGCQLGDLDHAAHAFGLATPAGILSTTGAGGLTLGGGHGYLSRKYGLTIDNLVGADVVLADGTFVKASESENADLFWALRGGGGNFGVVTQFTYRLHPVDTVIAGITFWPIEQAPEVLRWYRGFGPAQPDDVYGFFAVATVPPAPPFPEDIHLRKVCGVVWCITDPALQDDALGAAQAVGSPIFHFAATMHSTMHLYPIDGAVHRVGSGDTAWSFRDALWSGVFGGVDPDPANAGVIRDWAVGYQEALHKSSMGGAYVNFMMEEGQERVQATYRDNYPRLVEVKKQYDPDNFFHVNQNIKPTG